MSRIQKKREETLQREIKALEELPEAITRLKPFYQECGGGGARFIKEVIDGLIDGKAVEIENIHRLDSLNCEAIITILRAMNCRFGDVRLLLIKELRA